MPLLKDKSDFTVATETVKCPKCNALPGTVCTLLTGVRRGQEADSCHNERLRAAGFGSARESVYKAFSIPGSTYEKWDDHIHGRLMTEDQIGTEIAFVDWKPGEYTYVAGSSGNQYVFKVPEGLRDTGPNINVLKGIHAFLGELGL